MYIAIACCAWMLFVYRYPPKYTIQNEITNTDFECTSHVDGVYCCEIQRQFWYLTDFDGDRVYDVNRTMYPNCQKYVLNELRKLDKQFYDNLNKLPAINQRRKKAEKEILKFKNLYSFVSPLYRPKTLAFAGSLAILLI